MRLRTALVLGRVSNLPTVWTNMLAGIVLVGGEAADWRVLPLGLALSLFYVGGMYLNDAFDAAVDSVERPERPIPSGLVARAAVFIAGYSMLVVGVLLLMVAGFVFTAGTGPWPALTGLALAVAILVYDAWHKTNPLSPVLMGLCRMMVYVIAGVTFSLALSWALWIGAFLLLSYLVGLTYTAKQEALDRVERIWPLLFLAFPVAWGLVLIVREPQTMLFWVAFVAALGCALWLIWRREPGGISRAVALMLAGICLFDAMLIAGAGTPGLALLAVAGFPLTLVLQRWVPGT